MFQLKELNTFSECLKKLSLSNDNKKLIIEAVGPRKDMYQNILPLLFDITVISDQLDEYNNKYYTTNSDCIFLDGPGKQYTKSSYYIEYDSNTKEYNLVQPKELDILQPYNYLKEKGISFY